ncbi:MAG: class I SAM-dependent methyltransferase [Microscillaceae bacterium]|jgi:hypothetical protein|nr:class I SAM-dependent methyltransferase [Microscillaceae bacterium]
MLVRILLCGLWAGLWACNPTPPSTKSQADSSKLLEYADLFSNPDKIKKELDTQKMGAYEVYQLCKQRNFEFSITTRFVRAIYAEPNREYDRKHKLEWYLSRLPLVEFAQMLYYFKEPQHRSFMDVGSGNGDKLYTALCMGFDKSYGVEYEQKLHETAEKALKPMSDKGLTEISQGDATKLPDAYFQKADFLYMYCPLVLNKPEQAKLLHRILKNMRDNTMLYEAGFLYAKEFKKLNPIEVEDGYRGFLAVKREKGKYYFRIFVLGWTEFEVK